MEVKMESSKKQVDRRPRKAKEKSEQKKKPNMSFQPDANEELSLEDVLALGGTKEDFDMLEGVKDGAEELVDFTGEDEIDLAEDELLAFISKVGFKNADKKESSEKKQKQKKLLSVPLTADDQLQRVKEFTDNVKKKKEKNKYKVQHPEVSSTSASPPKPSLNLSFLHTQETRRYLLFKPGSHWHETQFETDTVIEEIIPEMTLKKLEQYAANHLESEATLYRTQQEAKKSSDIAWIRTVLSSGTLTDKMAALTVLIQDAPVHSLGSLDTLINFVKKKGRRESLMATDTLRDLFLSDLLPDRKLIPFDQHPHLQLEKLSSGNHDSRDRRLLIWYYEAQLKDRYATFVQALEALSHDNIATSKRKAITTIYELLVNKPEQEKTLLSLLVNKLGDPDYKIAANCAHLLTTLVERHPAMKLVVVMEVERLLYRSNISAKAQYYGVCFLNQLVLSHSEKNLATRLISIYFSFFKSFIKHKELDTKMLSGLLTGVNRAYPFSKVEREKIEEQMSSLYKILHVVNFNTALQAFMLLYQVMDASDIMSDRYYTALYRKLLDPGLAHSSKQPMFLNLLFKSLKKDVSHKRTQAFIKRLLQVCSHQAPTFICAALVLISELLKVKPQLLTLSKKSEEEDNEEKFTDAAPDPSLSGYHSTSEDEEPENTENATNLKPTVASWVHRRNLGDKTDRTAYQPMSRNPLYSRADQECTWELQQLAQHYHPSVTLFAQTLLSGKSIFYSGDPLQDFTLIRFLDRFVYRNPKKKDLASISVMQSKRKQYIPKGVRAIPVNSEKFLEKGEENIPVDERFFYKYFKQLADKNVAKKVLDHDSDAESVSDTEFDDYLDTFEKGLVAEAEDDIDFARDFGKKKSSRKGAVDDSESEDDMDDLDDDLSDEEVDFGDDDFGDIFDDEDDEEMNTGTDDPGFDEEDIAFSDEDGVGDIDFTEKTKGKKRNREDDMFMNKKGKKSKSGKRDETASIFAAAEEFAHLIDENAGLQVDTIGTEAMANKDNAHVKQLKWEAERDRWLHGKDWRSNKKAKGFLKKGQYSSKISRGKPKGNKKQNQYKGKGKR